MSLVTTVMLYGPNGLTCGQENLRTYHDTHPLFLQTYSKSFGQTQRFSGMLFRHDFTRLLIFLKLEVLLKETCSDIRQCKILNAMTMTMSIPKKDFQKWFRKCLQS